MDERIAVIGLGYVGLPVALAFARRFAHVVGFDIDAARVEELRGGHDRTAEVDGEELRASSLRVSCDPADLDGTTAFVVTVPTPIDEDRRPDLSPLRSASELVGAHLGEGGLVVYESTVYPGVTEEFCGPILAEASGLTQGEGFVLGYSPERINPGDREHTLTRIQKVVSGQDAPTLERVARLYDAIVEAGVHRAPTIQVAEAAKVIENTQRDLNIALMNELAIIFDRLGIRTRDVLDAAQTKWNFLPFTPGLVGGHCIGVDPYYLTARAERFGYHPQVILAGRRINDGMGAFVARRLIKLLVHADRSVAHAKVAILGLTFKENVPDLRNSRVPDIRSELAEMGIEARVHDPLASKEEALAHHGVSLEELDALGPLDAVVLAVPHAAYLADPARIFALLTAGGVLMDVKSALDPSLVPEGIQYWSL